MARVANIPYENGQFIVSTVPLVQRINRGLERLRPYRQLHYKYGELQYYLRVLAPGDPLHLSEFGPIYGKYMIALADHINLWTVSERMMNPKVVRLKNGVILAQEPLPKAWQFDVVSNVLYDAVKALRSAGYTVTPPEVTAEVTQALIGHTPECNFHHDNMDCDCGYWESIIPDEVR